MHRFQVEKTVGDARPTPLVAHFHFPPLRSRYYAREYSTIVLPRHTTLPFQIQLRHLRTAQRNGKNASLKAREGYH